MGLQQVQPTLDTSLAHYYLHTHNTSNTLHRDTPGPPPRPDTACNPVCCVQPRPAWQRQVSLAPPPPPHSPQVGHLVTSLDHRHSDTLFLFFLLNIGVVYIVVQPIDNMYSSSSLFSLQPEFY